MHEIKACHCRWLRNARFPMTNITHRFCWWRDRNIYHKCIIVYHNATRTDWQEMRSHYINDHYRRHDKGPRAYALRDSIIASSRPAKRCRCFRVTPCETCWSRIRLLAKKAASPPILRRARADCRQQLWAEMRYGICGKRGRMPASPLQPAARERCRADAIMIDFSRPLRCC